MLSNESCVSHDSLLFWCHFFWLGFLYVDEVVGVGIDEGLPTGVDDVFADADGSEDLAFAVVSEAGAGDDDADAGGGFVAGVDDADLVVIEVDIADGGVIAGEGLSEG